MLSDNTANIKQATRLVDRELRRMHRDWHAWERSKLTRTNEQLQLKKAFTGDPEIIHMIKLAQGFHRDSNGLFDPAIGDLVETWGFYSDRPGSDKTKLPEQKDITNWLANKPSVRDIEITANQLRGNHSGLKLDFGGFAKGFALDKIAAQLIAIGVTDFILNAGGDLVVRGNNIKRHWQVGVRQPDLDNIAASMSVFDGEGVFSSGDYERYFVAGDQRIHHIIDPRNGQSAKGARAVTVVHRNATLADAAATALLIAGPDHWREIAAQMQVDLVMLQDQAGGIHLSDAMRNRLKENDSLTSAYTTDKM